MQSVRPNLQNQPRIFPFCRCVTLLISCFLSLVSLWPAFTFLSFTSYCSPNVLCLKTFIHFVNLNISSNHLIFNSAFVIIFNFQYLWLAQFEQFHDQGRLAEHLSPLQTASAPPMPSTILVRRYHQVDDEDCHHHHCHHHHSEVEFVTPVTAGGSVKFLPAV